MKKTITLAMGLMLTELNMNMLPSPNGFNGADISQNFEF